MNLHSEESARTTNSVTNLHCIRRRIAYDIHSQSQIHFKLVVEQIDKQTTSGALPSKKGGKKTKSQTFQELRFLSWWGAATVQEGEPAR